MKTKARTIAIIILGMIWVSCSQGQSGSETRASKPKTDLSEASFFGDLETVKQHIAYGSDLNKKDEYGSTPLNTAITFGKTEVAIALIEGGADLTITTPDNSTPLHTASFFGRVEIVEALINKGVNIDATNSYGSTALASVSIPFDQIKPAYDQISKDLGPFGFKLDYERLQKARIAISEKLSSATK